MRTVIGTARAYLSRDGVNVAKNYRYQIERVVSTGTVKTPGNHKVSIKFCLSIPSDFTGVQLTLINISAKRNVQFESSNSRFTGVYVSPVQTSI